MCSKIFSTITVAFLMFTIGCSTVEKVVYRPDINQGNYLKPTDVSKLQKGMNKQQIVYLLGTPMMQDPFGSNTWIYVFRQQPGHQDVKQKTLKLDFDSANNLIDIQSDFPLPKLGSEISTTPVKGAISATAN